MADVISQIVVPPEGSLQLLESDTRRIGALRVFDLPKRLRRQGKVALIADQYECVWKMEEGKDLYFNQIEAPFTHCARIEEMRRVFRMPELSPRREELYSLFDIQVRKASAGVGFIVDRVCAGLTEMFFRFRGYEQGLIDMLENPIETREILERIADYKIQYWDMVADYLKSRNLKDSVLVASECDDLGTQQSLLVSPEILSEVVFPPMRRYLGWMKKRLTHCRIFFHCDGAIRPIIPDLIEMGIDILNPVQYSATGMDLVELKREFGKDLVFWGAGIDTQGTLVKGPVSKIREEVRRNIETLAPGGGYVFAPIHNVQADVPPEHFWAMWEAWKEFGLYW
jgi:uroporphyrinogen decarboxylase